MLTELADPLSITIHSTPSSTYLFAPRLSKRRGFSAANRISWKSGITPSWRIRVEDLRAVLQAMFLGMQITGVYESRIDPGEWVYIPPD